MQHQNLGGVGPGNESLPNMGDSTAMATAHFEANRAPAYPSGQPNYAPSGYEATGYQYGAPHQQRQPTDPHPLPAEYPPQHGGGYGQNYSNQQYLQNNSPYPVQMSPNYDTNQYGQMRQQVYNGQNQQQQQQQQGPLPQQQQQNYRPYEDSTQPLGTMRNAPGQGYRPYPHQYNASPHLQTGGVGGAFATPDQLPALPLPGVSPSGGPASLPVSPADQMVQHHHHNQQQQQFAQQPLQQQQQMQQQQQRRQPPRNELAVPSHPADSPASVQQPLNVARTLQWHASALQAYKLASAASDRYRQKLTETADVLTPAEEAEFNLATEKVGRCVFFLFFLVYTSR